MNPKFIIFICITILQTFCNPVLDKEEFVSSNLKFFEDGKGIDLITKLPHDNITVKENKIAAWSNYTNSTEIGLYLNILSLIDKKIIKSEKISPDFAKNRIVEILEILVKLNKWNGLFYWAYDFQEKRVVPGSDLIVPAVDNGNLSFSLATLAGAYLDSDFPVDKKIISLSEKILSEQIEGYAKLYKPEMQLLGAGWDAKNNKLLQYQIDRKMNESRLAVIWAILNTNKKVPMKAFQKMELNTAQYKKLDGTELEYYLTWDGTIFQALFPALFLEESELIPDYTKVKNIVYVQEDYIRKNWIPAFISASSTPDNNYTGMGTMEMAELVVSFKNPTPYIDFGTPHATALTFLVDPKLSLAYMTKLKKEFPQIDSGEFGWFDAISKKGIVNSKILSLDQGMLILSFYAKENRFFLKNYLKQKGKWSLLTEIYSHFH